MPGIFHSLWRYRHDLACVSMPCLVVAWSPLSHNKVTVGINCDNYHTKNPMDYGLFELIGACV